MKFAAFPAVTLPSSSSSRQEKAASEVTARSASCTVMRCSGATTRPEGVRRLTANEASCSGAAGPIGRSECNDNGMSRLSTEAALTMESARPAPRPCAA